MLTEDRTLIYLWLFLCILTGQNQLHSMNIEGTMGIIKVPDQHEWDRPIA